MSDDTIKVNVSTGFNYAINSYKDHPAVDTGIPREEWAEMTEEERDKELDQVVQDVLLNCLDASVEVSED